MPTRAFMISTLTLLVCIAAPSACRAAPRVDPNFGNGGLVHSEFGTSYSETNFTSIEPQPGDSFIAGRRMREDGSKVLRFEANGTPSLTPPPVQAEGATAVDGEGRTLRATYGGLERINTDGSTDDSFGFRRSETPREELDVPFRIDQILPLPSGKILVAGEIIASMPEKEGAGGYNYVEQVAAGLFESDGVLDPNFGSGGVVRLRTAFGLKGEELQGLFARPGEGVGVIVSDTLASPYGESGVHVGGNEINLGHPYGLSAAHSGSFIVGLTETGQLDPNYGSGGVIRLEHELVVASHSLTDGSLLVAGDLWGPEVDGVNRPDESDLFMARYTTAGQLDPTFGSAGRAVDDLGGIDIVRAALWESDGSVLLGGATTDVQTAFCLNFGDFCLETPVLASFTSNGHLDPAFGSGGLVQLSSLSNPFGNIGGGTGVSALAPRGGGGILAGGGSGTKAFIAALQPGGSLDPAFGGNDGFITEAAPSNSRSQIHALVTDRKGRILIAGSTSANRAGYEPEAAIFRYLPNGAIDRSFGEGSGYVRVPGEANDIALAPNGGAYVLSGRYLPAVTRLTPSGQIDRHFGEEGTVLLSTKRLGGRSVVPNSIAVLPDRDIAVAASGGGAQARIAVFCLHPDGKLDRSFGSDGIAQPHLNADRDGVNQLAADPDGRIVLAGYLQDGSLDHLRSEAMTLVRLLPDGSVDRSFGRRGMVVTRVGKLSFASSLAIAPGGAILVAGRARARSYDRELLLSYTRAGRLDKAFAHDGISNVPAVSTRGQTNARPRQILLADHQVLVVRDDRHRQLLVYSRDGRPEGSFAVAGSAEPKNQVALAPLAALQGRRLVLGWQDFGADESFKLQRLVIR